MLAKPNPRATWSWKPRRSRAEATGGVVSPLGRKLRYEALHHAGVDRRRELGCLQVDELSLGRLDGRVASGDEVAFGVVEAGRGPSSDSM